VFENGVETIMRRYAGFHVEQLGEPVLPGSSEGSDGYEVISTSDHCADGYEEDVGERTSDLSTSRISDVIEMFSEADGTFQAMNPERGASPGSSSERPPSDVSPSLANYAIALGCHATKTWRKCQRFDRNWS